MLISVANEDKGLSTFNPSIQEAGTGLKAWVTDNSASEKEKKEKEVKGKEGRREEDEINMREE